MTYFLLWIYDLHYLQTCQMCFTCTVYTNHIHIYPNILYLVVAVSQT